MVTILCLIFFYWVVSDLQEFGLNYLIILEYLHFNFYSIFYIIKMFNICKYIKYTKYINILSI